MFMKIAVINLKGGVGKTPLAFSIAKDLGFYYQSNDNSLVAKIYPEMARISAKLEIIDDCVYDFGGFVDHQILAIIKECDFVIVPCIPDWNSIYRTHDTLSQIAEYAVGRIIVVCSALENKADLEMIGRYLIENKVVPVEYFYLKFSKIFKNSIGSGKSFLELYNENGLSKNQYGSFIAQYIDILKYIKQKRVK